MLAKDIMRKKVVVVAPQMTLREVALIFDDHRITGAPVVGAEGELLGVISQTDLVRHEREAPPPEIASFHQEQEEALYSGGLHGEEPDYTRVEQIMTPGIISFEEDTPIQKLAGQMLRKRIHRVIITRQGKLAGIVTSMDMLKAILAMTGSSRENGRLAA